MKNIIFLLLFLTLGVAAMSQTVIKSAAYPTNSIDTVTDAGTKYLSITSANTINGTQKVVTVAVNVLKISGTAGGTLSLEGSLDGTNWYAASATTATVLNVSTAQAFKWTIVDFGDIYLRVKYVGTGTMSASFGAKYIARKP